MKDSPVRDTQQVLHFRSRVGSMKRAPPSLDLSSFGAQFGRGEETFVPRCRRDNNAVCVLLCPETRRMHRFSQLRGSGVGLVWFGWCGSKWDCYQYGRGSLDTRVCSRSLLASLVAFCLSFVSHVVFVAAVAMLATHSLNIYQSRKCVFAVCICVSCLGLTVVTNKGPSFGIGERNEAGRVGDGVLLSSESRAVL